MRNRRVVFLVLMFMFGLFALLGSMSGPRFEAFHGSDVVQLVASGLCFGVGFGVLLGKHKFPGE